MLTFEYRNACFNVLVNCEKLLGEICLICLKVDNKLSCPTCRKLQKGKLTSWVVLKLNCLSILLLNNLDSHFKLCLFYRVV